MFPNLNNRIKKESDIVPIQMSGIIRLEVPRAWYSPVVKSSLLLGLGFPVYS